MTQHAEYFTIRQIKSDLVFIQWYRSPEIGSPVSHEWVNALEALLDKAGTSQYFFSDVRCGQVTDLGAIKRAAQFVKHRNYGGSVALGGTISAYTYVQITMKNGGDDPHVFPSLEEALHQLECYKAGITQNVDWNRLLTEMA